MRKLRSAIRELDDLTGSEDYLLASEEAATVVDECRRLLAEAGHADHAESLSDLGGRADPQIAGDRLRTIVAALSTPDTLTPPQVAKKYGVSPEAVRGWIQAGQLKATNLSKASRPRYRIMVEALAEFDRLRSVKERPKVERRRKPAKLLVTRFSGGQGTKPERDS